jgi:DNA-directed RNA polymerase subunit M/transcription elongation factor TFIIS
MCYQLSSRSHINIISLKRISYILSAASKARPQRHRVKSWRPVMALCCAGGGRPVVNSKQLAASKECGASKKPKLLAIPAEITNQIIIWKEENSQAGGELMQTASTCPKCGNSWRRRKKWADTARRQQQQKRSVEQQRRQHHQCQHQKRERAIMKGFEMFLIIDEESIGSGAEAVEKWGVVAGKTEQAQESV